MSTLPTTSETNPNAGFLMVAGMAGVAWAIAIGMLLLSQIDQIRDPLAPLRVLFYLVALAAGVLTFLPLELRLRIPGLAFEGTIGGFLLLYTLAFVPAPTGSLLSPPDAPIYLLFAAALFWFVSAAALPAAAAIGQRLFRERARQYDLRRASRQAREVAAACAICVILAGLRVLTLPGALLVVLIVVVAELVVLSFMKTADR